MLSINSPFGKAVLALLALLIAIFSASSIVLWQEAYGWHDQQRVAQLLLIFFVAVLVFFVPLVVVSRTALACFFWIFCIGFVSCLMSAFPQWAFLEWARYGGLLLLVLLFAEVAKAPAVVRFVLGAMVCIGALQAFQFLLSYLMAFVSGILDFSGDVLITGFTNRRYFGQFQVMLMPILALGALLSRQHQRPALAFFLLLVLSVHWCIALLLAGRGLWLGLVVSHILVMLVCHRFWRLVVLQVFAALLGAVVFLLLFKLVPFWLELNLLLEDGLRAGLSYREIIWQAAWDMAVKNPWVGVGPMHYSAIRNTVAAHPHQAILQWLAEWGFAATAMALLVAARGVWRAVVCLRSEAAEAIDAGLAMAILGALVLAQVDGVFVMPYTETWLALLAGLALARWSLVVRAGVFQFAFMRTLAFAVFIVFLPVLAKQLPFSPLYEKAYLQKSKSTSWPRFWQDGWIPWAP